MFWKNQKFKEIEKEWYCKLEQSGFTDIEKPDDDFKRRAKNLNRKDNRHNIVFKQEYYSKLTECVEIEDFDTGLDYFVMARFSEGANNSEICQELKKYGQTRHRKTIMFIRRKYENRWGIIKWKPEQLKSRTMPYKRRSR